MATGKEWFDYLQAYNNAILDSYYKKTERLKYKLGILFFVIGSVVVVMQHFAEALSTFFGSFGALLLALALLFPMWQGWAALIIGYLYVGYFLFSKASYDASGPRGLVLNPNSTPISLVLWCLFWLILKPLNRKYFNWEEPY